MTAPTPPAPAHRVLGIAGSLRAGSLNRALLRAAGELAPPALALVPFELAGIPLYDGDLEAAGDPAPVARLKAALAEADALLIATPEYNAGMPAVLKNALDWASRPPSASPLAGLPVAVIGVSPGRGGTARAQAQLGQTLASVRAAPVPGLELRVGRAHERFAHRGGRPELTDPATRAELAALMAALAAALSPAVAPPAAGGG